MQYDSGMQLEIILSTSTGYRAAHVTWPHMEAALRWLASNMQLKKHSLEMCEIMQL